MTSCAQNTEKCHADSHPVEQTVPTQPSPGNAYKALAALRYYRDECSCAEPSISVFHRMVDEALEAAPADAQNEREFPPLTPELARILGTMCFDCIHIARALRLAGHQINTRAEDEQAATLHWMLGHYFRHGEDGWRKAAMDDIERMRAAALAEKEMEAV